MMLRAQLLMFFCALTVTVSAQKPYRGDGADDWMRFVPLASVFALKACGLESASSWKRLAVNAAMSCVLSSGVTWGLKHAVRERRPDWTDRHSFPSGHTSFVFAGATILDKEYRHVSPWISIAGYAVATGVAVGRIVRHRHYWHDVAVGAGLSVGGTMLGYWLGSKIIGWRSKCSVGVGQEGVAVTVNL